MSESDIPLSIIALHEDVEAAWQLARCAKTKKEMKQTSTKLAAALLFYTDAIFDFTGHDQAKYNALKDALYSLKHQKNT